jgi:hypothetical protein
MARKKAHPDKAIRREAGLFRLSHPMKLPFSRSLGESIRFLIKTIREREKTSTEAREGKNPDPGFLGFPIPNFRLDKKIRMENPINKRLLARFNQFKGPPSRTAFQVCLGISIDYHVPPGLSSIIFPLFLQFL